MEYINHLEILFEKYPNKPWSWKHLCSNHNFISFKKYYAKIK